MNICHSMNIWTHSNKKLIYRVNGILAKLRYYISADILKNNYALFDSHMRYACQIWVRVTVKHLIWYNALRTRP